MTWQLTFNSRNSKEVTDNFYLPFMTVIYFISLFQKISTSSAILHINLGIDKMKPQKYTSLGVQCWISFFWPKTHKPLVSVIRFFSIQDIDQTICFNCSILVIKGLTSAINFCLTVTKYTLGNPFECRQYGWQFQCKDNFTSEEFFPPEIRSAASSGRQID